MAGAGIEPGPRHAPRGHDDGACSCVSTRDLAVTLHARVCASQLPTAQLSHVCPCVCAMYLAALNLRITDPHTGRSTHVALGGGTCICTRGPAPWILRESQSVWMTAATHDRRCTLKKHNKGNEAELSMCRMRRRSGNRGWNGRSPHILNNRGLLQLKRSRQIGEVCLICKVWHIRATWGAGGVMVQRLKKKAPCQVFSSAPIQHTTRQ